MLRFRCPKCNNTVKVGDADAAEGFVSCSCGQQVRLPDTVRPSAPPARRPTGEALAGVRPAASPPIGLQYDEFDVIDGEEVGDTEPRRLPRPGVVGPDGDNYADYPRYRQKPKRQRDRRRRDLPTASLIMEWITPFSVSLGVLLFLSSVFGFSGLFFEGPEIGLVILGLLVLMAGALWFLVQTIQDGEYFYCAFIPGYSLLYALRNYDTAGKAMVFQFVGVGILIMAGIVSAVPGRRVLAWPVAPPPPPPPAVNPIFMPPGPDVCPPPFLPGGEGPPPPIPPFQPEPAGPFVPKEGPPNGLRGDPIAATDLEGLLGYWSLDEKDGKRAADSSGNGNPGKVQGQWIGGVRGKALWLRNDGDSLDYGASPKFNHAAGSAFSYAGWVQTRAREGAIVSQRNSEDGSPVIDIGLKAGRISFVVREDGNEVNSPGELHGDTVNDGEWHHFACVRTRDGRLKLYLDGLEQSSVGDGSFKGAITTDWRSVGVEKFWVQKRGAGHPYLAGCVDEICIFGRELSVDEVRKLAGQ